MITLDGPPNVLSAGTAVTTTAPSGFWGAINSGIEGIGDGLSAWERIRAMDNTSGGDKVVAQPVVTPSQPSMVAGLTQKQLILLGVAGLLTVVLIVK